MYLDYSKIEFDANGAPEMPELVLQTPGGKTIGVIPGVFNLKLNIKYSEPSEISFDVPAKIDGAENPFYDLVVGHKLIYTKCYGIYMIMNPKSEEDGISDVKHIKGYSCEKTLESKKFFMEEGTFNFWNPASPTDTVIGRILEIAAGWKAGYIAPSLIGRYRTFDKYDDYLLSFIYNKAPKKFRCIFVFDTYKKTINAYDADAEYTNLPIYLDFDNLLESLEIVEKDDELVTAIRPYGADGLDIRGVNPIGTNWIYDISYFIANGDIKDPLASKWQTWQRSVINHQLYYKGLVAMQASATARLLSEKAELADLKGELENLTAQQSVTIQAISIEITDAGRASQQAVLDDVNKKIAAKKSEISAKEAAIAAINSELDADNPASYTARIQAVASSLSIRNYFTAEEYIELTHYFHEQDITEDTFVATTVDASVSGSSYSLQNESVSVSGSAISEVDLSSDFGKRMFVMAGGTFSLSGSQSLSGDIIRGTLEVSGGSSYVLSFYAGTIRTANRTAPSGMITLSGTLSGLSSNISSVTADGITSREGSSAGTSIGDLHTQLGFLMKELSENYQNVLATLMSTASVREASDAVLLNFERPKDMGIDVQEKRACCGQIYYDKFTLEKEGDGGTMSNSPLVSYTRLSPNCTKPRNHAIDTITIHCVVGQFTAKQICDLGNFTNYSAASGSPCNYAVGKDGSIGLCVEEANRSWCSSNKANDHRAITIEVASDTTSPYAVTDMAYRALINLLVDICQRNGIRQLLWKGDKSLIGQVDKQNMTVHRWFANKACPGDFLYDLHGQIAAAVNGRLNANNDKEDDDMDVKKFKELWGEMPKELQDNDSGNWSKDAREWAVSTGLIAGSNTEINGEPNYMWADILTREQFVTVLYRFAKIMGKA